MQDMAYLEKPECEVYRKLLDVSNSVNEEKDCTVITLSLATGRSYHEIRKVLMEKYGRRHRHGPSWRQFEEATYDLCGDVTDVTKCFKAKTVRTLERELKKRGDAETYIVWVHSHVLCIKKGEVLDWTLGTCKRVHRIFKVVVNL